MITTPGTVCTVLAAFDAGRSFSFAQVSEVDASIIDRRMKETDTTRIGTPLMVYSDTETKNMEKNAEQESLEKRKRGVEKERMGGVIYHREERRERRGYSRDWSRERLCVVSGISSAVSIGSSTLSTE
jgi:hypothetical protein